MMTGPLINMPTIVLSVLGRETSRKNTGMFGVSTRWNSKPLYRVVLLLKIHHLAQKQFGNVKNISYIVCIENQTLNCPWVFMVDIPRWAWTESGSCKNEVVCQAGYRTLVGHHCDVGSSILPQTTTSINDARSQWRLRQGTVRLRYGQFNVW